MGGSLFAGLQIALSGLQAQQAALDVAGNNIANASTPGYAREQLRLQPLPVEQPPSADAGVLVGIYGQGVTVAGIQRVQSRFLESQQWQNDAALSQETTTAQTLGQVQAFFDEPSSTGLASALDAFWNAWQNVSDQPTSLAARSTLLAQAQALTEQFNTLGQQLQSMQGSLNDQVASAVTQVNQLAAEIAGLNQQIESAVSSGLSASSLQDNRAQLIDQLVQLVGGQVSWSGGDTVTIAVGGVDLVASGQAQSLVAERDSSGMWQLSWSGGAPATLASGKLAALLQLRDQVIGGPQGYLSRLDQLASQLIQVVNGQHEAGFDLQGQPGLPFFVGDSANTIAVNPALASNPQLVAAAASASGVPGDGSNALAVSQLQNQRLAAMGGDTLNGFYATLVGAIGSDAQLANHSVDNLQALQQAIANQQQEYSGVSINDEMTKVVEAQNAYAAAAQVTVAINAMLGDLIQSA